MNKYIREKNLVPPDQDVFERIRDKLAWLYLDSIKGPTVTRRPGQHHSAEATADGLGLASLQTLAARWVRSSLGRSREM